LSTRLVSTATVGALMAMSAMAASQKVEIRNSAGQLVGTAVVSDKAYLLGQQSLELLSFKFDLKGLPPGDHRVSIHVHASCDAPGFATVGDQLLQPNLPEEPASPASRPEKLEEAFGDLGNISVKADGKAKATLEANATAVPIEFGAAPSVSTALGLILRNGGASLVIDAQPDDLRSNPDGKLGEHIACGLILP